MEMKSVSKALPTKENLTDGDVGDGGAGMGLDRWVEIGASVLQEVAANLACIVVEMMGSLRSAPSSDEVRTETNAVIVEDHLLHKRMMFLSE
jgi:hypothetical protein